MAKARPIDGLHQDLPFAAAAALTVRVRADELFAHAAGVLDTDDIERVHDMRVATRRLRAVLEIYAACFPDAALRSVLNDVKALADGLGARRDPDVQLEDLQSFAASLNPDDGPGIDLFAARLRAEQQEGNAILARALDAATEHDLQGRLAALVAGAEEGATT
ncbi:MAG: domain containing protein [Solirubrobacterales bacterium]|nr:domain containing protein [Solirubrobacterales bacterium]